METQEVATISDRLIGEICKFKESVAEKCKEANGFYEEEKYETHFILEDNDRHHQIRFKSYRDACCYIEKRFAREYHREHIGYIDDDRNDRLRARVEEEFRRRIHEHPYYRPFGWDVEALKEKTAKELMTLLMALKSIKK